MRSTMVLGSLLLTLVFVSACGGRPPPPATLTIENASSFVIREVHLATVGNDTWGPDLLTRDLRPGESFFVDGIPCDRYDVLVVDETNVGCVLPNLRLCFSDDVWVVDDAALNGCAFTM